MQAAKRHSSGGIRRLGQDRDFEESSVVLVRKSGSTAGGKSAPCGSLKTALRVAHSKGLFCSGCVVFTQWQQTEQHEWHREGGDSDRLST